MAGSRRERQTMLGRLERLEDHVMTLHAALERQLAESVPSGGSVERLVSLMHTMLDLNEEQKTAVKGLHDEIAALKEQVAAQRRDVDAFTCLTRSLMTLAWLAAQKVGVTSEEFVEAEAAFDANMLLKEFEGWASLLDPRPED